MQTPGGEKWHGEQQSGSNNSSNTHSPRARDSEGTKYWIGKRGRAAINFPMPIGSCTLNEMGFLRFFAVAAMCTHYSSTSFISCFASRYQFVLIMIFGASPAFPFPSPSPSSLPPQLQSNHSLEALSLLRLIAHLYRA